LYLHIFGLQLQIQGLQAQICTILELLIEQRQSIQQLEDELDTIGAQANVNHNMERAQVNKVIQVSDSSDSNTPRMRGPLLDLNAPAKEAPMEPGMQPIPPLCLVYNAFLHFDFRHILQYLYIHKMVCRRAFKEAFFG